MKTLDEIAVECGTDKSSKDHDYCRIYDALLSPVRNSEFRMLELGVQQGFSIWMWLEYFTKANVHGWDIDPLPQIEDYRTSLRPLNSTDPVSWEGSGEFRLIIDDAGHTHADVIRNFELGFPHVESGGWYVVEDLHALYHPKYASEGKDAFAYFLSLIHLLNESDLAAHTLCGKVRGNVHGIHWMKFMKSLLIIGKA